MTLLSLGLQCNLSQVDWDKLQYYSRKVKFFIALPPDNYDVEVHPSTYIRIAQLQSSALFPSLRHFRYDLDAESLSLSLSLPFPIAVP